MQPHLNASIEEALYDYKDMPTDHQRKKVDQVLLMHTNGDPHAAEGLRLTFEALVSGRPLPARTSRVGNLSAQAKIKTVDHLQQTLNLKNAPKIAEKLQKIDTDIDELTHLLFPFDREIAGELVQRPYRCQPQ
ncbi:MAG: hypothetical protein Q9161_005893 [Pseudevernia consocians]